MSRNRIAAPSARGISSDGMFINREEQEGNYRTSSVLGTEVRVWGGQGRGLTRDVISALRTLIRRVQPAEHLALMADYHPAEFGVVGSVLASEEYVVPDIIGNDCGCGLSAIALGIRSDALDRLRLERIFKEMKRTVPLGSAQNSEVRPHLQDLSLWQRLRGNAFVSSHALGKLRHQLGSLGGGNHFIEVAKDENETVWILVHSGSRYLGGLLREDYQGKTLSLGSEEQKRFMEVQATVLDYARTSRGEMVQRTLEAMQRVLDDEVSSQAEPIDLPHNFIELRSHAGATRAIHRKGACAAEEGQAGVIPGSMGTASYIVEGRGSAASFHSSSHGSGRLLSRGEAFRTLSTKDLFRDMQHVLWSGSEKLKDEAPKAYKDIDAVISAQRDLVRVRHRLKPLLSIKGEV